MIDECVVAVYKSVEKARDAIHRLTASGFPAGQISLVTVGFKDDPKADEQNPQSSHNPFDDPVVAATYEGWYSGRGRRADLQEKWLLERLLADSLGDGSAITDIRF